ncbi:helix-turn-helix domain-containing protein, partial [Streptomyces anthocyanicus]
TRTLLRRFGAETGRTPLAYLHTARVRRARHLLETTDRTIAAIAADVGYRDPGTFSAVFTRHAGRRPSVYRATTSPPAEHPPPT